ncbi:S26 family signal peptidase [Krasilnikovia sp. MM14-A1259]|uniref:S26 family signal peptidase n=1 Tax=Krasilnikovia sp. MM14-A1259 TaxID=3373539 RepID=UPI003803254B
MTDRTAARSSPGGVRLPGPSDADLGALRPRRAVRRVVAPLGAALLWIAAAVSWASGAPRPAVACGVPAVLVSLAALMSALLSRRLVMVTVRGHSMEPMFQEGDRVLVRRHQTPVRGQVVVIEQPRHGRPAEPPGPTVGAAEISARWWLIKRVAAAPGDPVPRDRFPALTDIPGDRVPPGKVILLGDNPQASVDSRQTGYFPVERVLGVLVGPASRVPVPPHIVRGEGFVRAAGSD